MSHFQYLICSNVNKIIVYEICKSLNSVFIDILQSVPTFPESGVYLMENSSIFQPKLYFMVFKTLKVHNTFY